jgi:hypothetical protein
LLGLAKNSELTELDVKLLKGVYTTDKKLLGEEKIFYSKDKERENEKIAEEIEQELSGNPKAPTTRTEHDEHKVGQGAKTGSNRKRKNRIQPLT